MPIGESADLKPNPTSPQSDVWLLALLSETWPTTRPWTLPAFRLCLQIPSPQRSWHPVPPVSLPLPCLHLNHTHHSAMWSPPCAAPASSARSCTLCMLPHPLHVPAPSAHSHILCTFPHPLHVPASSAHSRTLCAFPHPLHVPAPSAHSHI